MRRAGIEEGLGESSGGRAEVECHRAPDIEIERSERAAQLDRPTQRLRREDTDSRVGAHPRRWVRNGGTVDEDEAAGDDYDRISYRGEPAAQQMGERDERRARLG
jgi:hypothetical protein